MKKWRITIVVAFILFVIICCDVATWRSQPAYHVSSYEELLHTVGDGYYLPDKELLPENSECTFLVRLKNRFTEKATGYSISWIEENTSDQWISVECRKLGVETEDDMFSIHETEQYQGVPLEVDAWSVSFILKDHHYEIETNGSMEGETYQFALEIARNLIDQGISQVKE